jgi:hypothetical protein
MQGKQQKRVPGPEGNAKNERHRAKQAVKDSNDECQFVHDCHLMACIGKRQII